MPSFKNVLCWTVGFSAVQSVHSFLDTKSNSNLAVYWGMLACLPWSLSLESVLLRVGFRPEFWEYRPEAVELLLQ